MNELRAAESQNLNSSLFRLKEKLCILVIKSFVDKYFMDITPDNAVDSGGALAESGRTDNSLPYGNVGKKYTPLQPGPKEYLWDQILSHPINPPSTLVPPAPIAPIEPNRTHPISPTWTLTQSSRYRCGIYYAAPRSSLIPECDVERYNLRSIINPPNIRPTWEENKFIDLPIPGMVQMPPGIPFVYHVNGDSQKAITVGCLHTGESLGHWPDGPLISELSLRLRHLTFGRLGNKSERIQPIFAYENLRRNDRSAVPDLSGEHPYDGSYSLGGTVEKGHGAGKVVPAAQISYGKSNQQIGEILGILNRLYRLVMPHMLSKLELDVADFHSKDNNVFSIGGIAPCGTSVQMNVSSTWDELSGSIGSQGLWHTDPGDAITKPTFFVLPAPLATNPAQTTFLLGRPGLYSRVKNQSIIFLCFRGNDPHSGSSPTMHPEYRLDEESQKFIKEMNLLWSNAGNVNRVGYVVYHTRQATDRTDPLSATPETYFGNHGTLGVSMNKSRNFAEHGRHILGSEKDAATRFAIEAVMNFANQLATNRQKVEPDFLKSMMESITYFDMNAQKKCRVGNIPFNAFYPEEAERAKTLRRHYQYYENICDSIHLGISRTVYTSHKEKEKEKLLGLALAVPRPIAQTKPLENLPPPLELHIVEVKGHVFKYGQDWYNVLDSNGQETLRIESDLRHPNDSAKITEFLKLHRRPAPKGVVRNGRPSANAPAPRTTTPLHISAPPASKLTDPLSNLPARPPVRSTTTAPLPSPPGPTPLERPPITHRLRNTPEQRSDEPFGGKRKRKGQGQTRPNKKPSRGARSSQRNVNRGRNYDEDGEEGDGEDDEEEVYEREDSAEDTGGEKDEDNEELLEAEYEVERILEHQLKNNAWHFLVAFKGYHLKKAEWYSETNLPDARELIQEYKESKKLMDLDSPPNGEALDNIPAPHSHSARLVENLPLLRQICCRNRLTEELQMIRSQQTTFRSHKKSLRNVGEQLKQCVSRLMSFNKEMNISGAILARSLIRPAASAPDNVQTYGIEEVLARTNRAIQESASLSKDGYIMNILSAIIRWQECRIALIVSDFYFFELPNLTTILFNAHQHLHHSFLQEYYPVYAELVDTIAVYALATRKDVVQKMNKKGRGKKKSKSGIPASHEASAEEEIPKPPVPRPLIPKNLFGIRSDIPSSSTATFTLPRITGHKKTPDEVYKAAEECFQNVLIDHLLVPLVVAPRTEHKLPDGRKDLYDYLIRAAMLRPIIDEFDNEGICLTSLMQDLLKRPNVVLSCNTSTPEQVVAALKKDPEGVIGPLRAALRKIVTPEARGSASELGSLFHQQLLLFANPNSASTFTSSSVLPSSRRSGLNHIQRGYLGPQVVLTCDNTLKKGEPPRYGMLGMILREAFNQRYNDPPAEQKLSDYLQGIPADARSKPSGDIDQADPIRSRNAGALLLRKKLPGFQLTRRQGLSNLLAFVGTGQGTKTKSFLHKSDAEFNNGVDKFFSETLEDCLQLFEGSLKTNQRLMEDACCTPPEFEKERPLRNVAGFVQLSNSCIYGSTANLLKLLPTKVGANSGGAKMQCTVAEKFGPYWTDEICDAWVEFLGEAMLDSNPEEFSGQRKTWIQCIDFVVGLNIPGFQSGLSVLQLVNNLVLARLIDQPTLRDLAMWIWSNQRLGAFQGLFHMGFIPINRDAVFVALQLIYRHLDTHLITKQKETFRWDIFGVLIIEHLLCKVKRWGKKITTLEEDARKAEDQGAPEGTLRFPFPLRQTLEEVKNVLASLEVPGIL